MPKPLATAPSHYVDAQALKPLFRRRPMKHAGAILFNWATIVGTAYLCTQYFNPLAYLLAVLIIGARMHALAILMHDATHFRFLQNRKWNDLVTNITTMYPMFSTIERYRQNHLRHHKNLNTEQDPDWAAKLDNPAYRFPKSNWEFIGTLVSYFALYPGIRDAISILKRFAPTEKPAASARGGAQARLAFYMALIGVLTLFNLWKAYALFWLVPYVSTLFMFQYIRSVAEHFGALKYDHELNSSRTVKPTAIERFFLAPHHVGYHLEHHLYPGVPFYNLPALHNLLMQNPSYEARAHITNGYWKGLTQELGPTSAQFPFRGHEVAQAHPSSR